MAGRADAAALFTAAVSVFRKGEQIKQCYVFKCSVKSFSGFEIFNSAEHQATFDKAQAIIVGFLLVAQ